jgi:DNA-binding NtrC family response regulator
MRPERVLIVDDDGATRRGLVQLLTQAGYEATAVGTFDEARRIIGASPPDLLITDIRLEAYNGLQLILNSPRTIPTIVITGFADPVLEAEARRGGAAYLVKPVQPLELLEAVAEKLAARHSRPGIQ